MTDRSLPLLRWLTSLRPAPGRAVLACAHTRMPRVAADTVAIQAVGCLAKEELVLPAQLLVSGPTSLGVLTCAERPGEVGDLVARWSQVLDGIVLVPSVTAGRPWQRRGPAYRMGIDPASGPAVSRRMLIWLARQRPTALDLTADEAARGLEALDLLRAQGRARLDSPRQVSRVANPTAVRLMATGCVACGVCVAACTHQALEIVDEAGMAVLQQLPDRCRADQACVRLCPSDALSVVEELSLLDLVGSGPDELARVETARCGRCGARHPVSDGELCPPCAFRAEHAFGSTLPPSMAGR